MTVSRRKRTKSPDFISRNKKRFHGAKIFGKKKNDAGQTSIRNPKKMLFAGGRGESGWVANNIGEILCMIK